MKKNNRLSTGPDWYIEKGLIKWKYCLGISCFDCKWIVKVNKVPLINNTVDEILWTVHQCKYSWDIVHSPNLGFYDYGSLYGVPFMFNL